MTSKPFFENVVVVTGASTGIGRELALQLADQGAQVALAARNRKKLEEVASLCQQKGGDALPVPTDVSDQSQCKNLVERTVEKFGRIGTLINNAGISMHTRFDELQDVSIIEKIMQVNFFGSMYCAYYALPYLKQSKGRLVGVSSYAGKFPTPMGTGYGASKHAMAGFFDSLRVELRDTGVSVTMAYFSWVETGISSRMMGADGSPLGKPLDHETDAMTVEECCRLIIDTAAKRKREFLPLHGKFGSWVKLLFPAMIDQEAIRTLE